MDKMRGAKEEAGRVDLPVGEGEPRPDMPDTLYLWFGLVLTAGRMGGTGGTLLLLLSLCRLPADMELVRAGVGGELPPYIELNVDEDLFVAAPEPLFEPLPPMLESVLLSVLKLDLDLRRISLRKEGAIALTAHVYRDEGDMAKAIRGNWEGAGGETRIT
jgi:hypothetical protein